MNTKLKLTKLLNDTKKNNEPIKKVSGLPIHVNKTRKKGVKYSILKFHDLKISFIKIYNTNRQVQKT